MTDLLAHSLSDAAAAAAEIFDLDSDQALAEFLSRVRHSGQSSLPDDLDTGDRFAARVAAEVCFAMKDSLRTAIGESHLAQVFEQIPDEISPLVLDAFLLRAIGVEVERIADLQGLRRLTVLQNLARAHRIITKPIPRGGGGAHRVDPLHVLARVIAVRAMAQGTQLQIRPRSVQVLFGRPKLEESPRPFVAGLPRRIAAERIAQYSAGRDLRVSDAHRGWSITMRSQRDEERCTLSFWMNDPSSPVRIRVGQELLTLMDSSERIVFSAAVGDQIEIRGLPQT